MILYPQNVWEAVAIWGGAAGQVYLPYHVRVLVPCYKEDLSIVRRTIMAAYDAALPAG